MHIVQSGPKNCLRNWKFLQKWGVRPSRNACCFSFCPLKLWCFSMFFSLVVLRFLRTFLPTPLLAADPILSYGLHRECFRNWWRIIWEIPWPTPWPSSTAGGSATSWSGATQDAAPGAWAVGLKQQVIFINVMNEHGCFNLRLVFGRWLETRISKRLTLFHFETLGA